MKIVSVVGARPQFIKCAPVSRALRSVATEVLVHTGQHYDENMTGVFFRELEIPTPDYNLRVGSGSHGVQTGEMLRRIEEILIREKPAYVLVYGDTNSTLAGALAAAKLHIPVVHIEAGLRSFNRRMPEEINRVVTDHLSALNFCPTEAAVRNLAQEGVTENVHLVGDVMYDAFLYNIQLAEKKAAILQQFNLTSKEYLLATVHRPENTDQPENLINIMSAFTTLAQMGQSIIIPAHPRLRKQLKALYGELHANLRLSDPLSYLEMLVLEKHAKVILTDSGGVQKEAYWCRVPCITLRSETEWVETVESGWNMLVGTDQGEIIRALSQTPDAGHQTSRSGNGDGKKNAARHIVEILMKHAGNN